MLISTQSDTRVVRGKFLLNIPSKMWSNSSTVLILCSTASVDSWSVDGVGLNSGYIFSKSLSMISICSEIIFSVVFFMLYVLQANTQICRQ